MTETDLKNAKDFDGIVYLFNSSITDKMRQSASFYNVPVMAEQPLNNETFRK